MGLFKSKRERKFWILSIAVIITIYATIGIAGPVIGALRARGLEVFLFLFGMILVAATIIAHGLRTKPGKVEVAVWFGVAAVYLMVLLRVGILAERSHIIEYGVLAVFIHEALRERKTAIGQPFSPAILAILFTTIVGCIDELIQYFIPSRVFDTDDILFNFLAALMAIGSSLALAWARRLIIK